MKALIAALAATAIMGIGWAHAQSGPCIDPVSLGAVPDDNVSDRVAFQAALDLAAAHNGGTICVPAGRFVFERAPLGSYNRFAALSTHGSNITLKGADPYSLPFAPPLLEVLPQPRSILALVGDQGAAGSLLFSIDASATNITIDGLKFTARDATNTDEQTHLIATSGVCSTRLGTCNPITNIVIRNCSFDHPRSLWRRGDSVRLLGNELTTLVNGVLVEGNWFSDSGRSAVELQRGVSNVTINANVIHCESCDQAIDGEASGVTAGLEVFDTRITNNVVTVGPGAQGDYDIALTSAVRAEISGNRLSRGIAMVRSRFVKIHDQDVFATMVQGKGVIENLAGCEGLEIDRVRLVRSGIEGAMIRVVPTTNGHCTDFKVRDSVLVQRTPGFGIYSQSSNGEVTNNVFVWSDVTVRAPAAIYGSGTVAPVTSFVATGNVVVGNLQAVVSVQASPLPVTGLIHSNRAVGTAVMCVGPGC